MDGGSLSLTPSKTLLLASHPQFLTSHAQHVIFGALIVQGKRFKFFFQVSLDKDPKAERGLLC